MKHIWKPLLIFLAIIVLFIYYYVAVVKNLWPFSYCLDMEKKGQLGDSFGAFNSLFTALAFGGLLLTLWYQSKSMEEAKKDNDRQHFENILFRMLEVHNNIIRDIDVHNVYADNAKPRELIAVGRDCFLFYYEEKLKKRYQVEIDSQKSRTELDVALSAYKSFWDEQRHNLAHYFRYLYNMFKFIKQANLGQQEKQKYSNIIRAQISDYELLILFYNCISPNGVERFKLLAEKFALFNNLPEELLLDISHKNFYENTAFAQ